MAHVMTIKNGKYETVFDMDDVLYLVEQHMGDEVRRYLEEYLAVPEANEDYVADLEQQRDHTRSVMEALRQESETIAKLISQPEIDRKALSAAAGKIGTITWREISV